MIPLPVDPSIYVKSFRLQPCLMALGQSENLTKLKNCQQLWIWRILQIMSIMTVCCTAAVPSVGFEPTSLTETGSTNWARRMHIQESFIRDWAQSLWIPKHGFIPSKEIELNLWWVKNMMLSIHKRLSPISGDPKIWQYSFIRDWAQSLFVLKYDDKFFIRDWAQSLLIHKYDFIHS